MMLRPSSRPMRDTMETYTRLLMATTLCSEPFATRVDVFFQCELLIENDTQVAYPGDTAMSCPAKVIEPNNVR